MLEENNVAVAHRKNQGKHQDNVLDEACYRQMEEEMERLRREKDIVESKYLEAQQKLAKLEDLASSVAHELCTPLSAVTISVDSLLNFLPQLLHRYFIKPS